MPKGRISKRSVDALICTAGKDREILWDDAVSGFGVVVFPSGKKVYVAQYRYKRDTRRFTIGQHGRLTPEQARDAAKSLLAGVDLGGDPQGDRVKSRIPKPRELTLGDAVELYLPAAEKRLKASTYAGVVLHLRKHWEPLHHVELKVLERRHVAAELSRITAGGMGIGANRSRAALSVLFSWAIGEGLADMNPVIGTNKPGEEISRDRVLAGHELRLIWLHAGEGHYGAIVRLLALTGQRREEVASMQWPEIDFEKNMWSIPAARTKNGRAHDVPLATAAIEILQALPRLGGRSLVFGLGCGAFSGWSKAKERLDKRLRSAGMAAPWRLHDLRRSCATRMGDLGVQPHVVEAVLNHISGSKSGVAGVYNKAAYANEKRMALTLWADHVLAQAEDRASNLVSLQNAG
jgi:integrase